MQNARTERSYLAWAFAWAACEAVFFFVVPDVWLSWIGLGSLRKGLKAALAALLGALVGGLLLFEIASVHPAAARSFVVHVPGIDAELVERARTSLREHGFWGIADGLPRGIPYKVYAVESAATREDIASFLVGSALARSSRFFLAPLLANVAGRLLAPWTHRERKRELAVWSAFWIVFYAFYFWHFGW